MYDRTRAATISSRQKGATMATTQAVVQPDFQTLNDFYGWYYNLYLNGGKRIATVARRSQQIRKQTRMKLLNLISDFDQPTSGIQDFGTGQGINFTDKQVQKAGAISAKLVLLAAWVRELSSSHPNEFKALEEVGVPVALAAEWFDGVNCHHDVAKDLKERVETAAEKPGAAWAPRTNPSNKVGIVTQQMLDAYLRKKI